MRKSLTKENFWNEMYVKFPNSMKRFCDWIDAYKVSTNWNKMFAANENTNQLQSSKYKFHDIPYEMQQGIWIYFAEDILYSLFEQTDYKYSMDLAEDVNKVFNNIEQWVLLDYDC